MDDVEAINELDRRRVAGCNTGDASLMRSALSDDYVHVHTTGSVENADDYVANAAKGGRTIAPRELDIRVYGDSAVAIGPQVMTIRTPDGERVLNMICTQVAQRFPEGWRFVSLQATSRPA